MVTTSEITTEKIEQRSISLHEPRWLRQKRNAAWTEFLNAPPVNWKKSKTPVVDLDQSLRNLHFFQTPFVAFMAKPSPKGKAGEIILEDEKLIHLSLRKDLAYEGVFFSDFKTAVLERADLVEKYFSQEKMRKDHLGLFSQALWSNGYFLYVPEKLRIEEPFEITLRKSDHSPATIVQNIIIADQGAEVSVEENTESLPAAEGTNLFCMTTEVEAEQGSRISFYSIRDWKRGIYDLSSFQSRAKRDAVIQSLFVFRGAEAGRIECMADLLEDGAHIEHHGIVLGENKEKLKISAHLQHLAPNTHGFLQFKAGLKDHAYAYFDGQIKISPWATQATSRLQEMVMLLSPDARSDALPALHIEASQVQVSHSASVSKADPEEIFYAMSRGLSEEQSVALIMEGFFDEVLQYSKNPRWMMKARGVIL